VKTRTRCCAGAGEAAEAAQQGGKEAAHQNTGPARAGHANVDAFNDDFNHRLELEDQGGEGGGTGGGRAPGDAQVCVNAADKQAKGAKHGKGPGDGEGESDGRSAKSRGAVVNLLVEVLALALDAPAKTSVRSLCPLPPHPLLSPPRTSLSLSLPLSLSFSFPFPSSGRAHPPTLFRARCPLPSLTRSLAAFVTSLTSVPTLTLTLTLTLTTPAAFVTSLTSVPTLTLTLTLTTGALATISLAHLGPNAWHLHPRVRTHTGDRGGRKWIGSVAGAKTKGGGWALEASEDGCRGEGPGDVMRAGLAILEDWLLLDGAKQVSFPPHSLCRMIDICGIRSNICGIRSSAACSGADSPDGPSRGRHEELNCEEDRVLRAGGALVERLLEEQQHGSAIRAIALLRLFAHYPCARLVELFVLRHDWDAAEVACQEGGGAGDKEALVLRLLSNGKYKQGLRLSREWGIEWLLQQARQGYTKSAIDKLVAKSQVQMALQYAAGDVELQAYVALALIRQGKYAQGMDLRATLGLQDWVEEITPERVLAHEEQRRQCTVSLPPHLPVTAINFVDSHAALARAAAAVDAYLARARAHAARNDAARGWVVQKMRKEQRADGILVPPEDMFVVPLNLSVYNTPLLSLGGHVRGTTYT